MTPLRHLPASAAARLRRRTRTGWHRTATFAIGLALFAGVAVLLPAAPQPPEWIDRAINAAGASPLVALAADTPPPATILWHEEVITVDDDGTWKVRTRHVVRIDDVALRRLAVASVPYAESQRSRPKLEAWLVRPDEDTITYGRRRIIDRVADPRALATEVRVLSITAANDVRPGAVFAWQQESTMTPLFLQLSWRVQQAEPMQHWRLALQLPPAWQAQSTVFNHAPVKPRHEGSALVWEFRDLPGAKREQVGLDVSEHSVHLGLNLLPPADTRLHANTRTAPASWPGMSAHFTALYDARTEPTAEIKAQAHRLAAPDAARTAQDLATFVQDFNYVSINLDPTRGSGVIPRDAAATLASGYGDCKDKTTLLRSLLRAEGIESFPVLANTSDPHTAQPDWPSPGAFNHCIIAIKVNAALDASAVITHPRLGRLLFFDPTDGFTAFGDIPPQLHGSRVLLLAGNEGELLELPAVTATENQIDRTVTAELSATGQLLAHVTETYNGPAARRERARRHHLSPTQYEQSLTQRLVASMGATRLGEISTQDDGAGNFSLAVEVNAPAYARTMRNRFLVVKPIVVSRRNSVGFDPGAKRTQPVRLGPSSFTEHTRIVIPDGFEAVELPPDVTLTETWAHYSSTCRFEDGAIVHTRHFERDAVELSADRYAAMCTFGRNIADAEQTPALLQRSP